MRAALRAVGLILVLAVLPGCSAWLAPETPRERLVAAEADYEAAVTTIRDMTDQGLVTGDTAQTAATAIVAARSTLDFWHLMPDSIDRMTAGIAALTQLQALIRSMKGTPT